ncbi:sensor histidine kinase [Agromyces allii]|nr:HAMP domain-containing sensor histidine kinase [Agromyces allii]
MTAPEPNRRRAGVRLRVTAFATSVVAAALVLGAVALWAVVRASLYDGLLDGAGQDASAVASQLEESGTGSLGELDDDRLLQVVDSSGTVVSRSEGAPSHPVTSVEDPAEIVQVDGTSYVVAVEEADGGTFVIAGRETTDVDATVGIMTMALAVGIPLLVALVGVVGWLSVGRALAPVERMRRQVGDVTAASLNRRVDEPGTGDEIDRLSRTLNAMLTRLDLAQISQRRFISDASHELKSPLAVLRQHAELALTHPDRVPPAELSATVLEEGARLEALVRGMLLLARADEAALEVERRDVDLDDLLLDEAARLRTTTTLVVDTTGIGAVRVRGDEALLAQVVRNLVDNARGHADARVALSAAASAGLATVTVADDGPGIAVADRERVMHRFVRLDEARARHDGGTGLGLAIVDEIARAHGGSVRLDRDPVLGGARFVVELPVAEDG